MTDAEMLAEANVRVSRLEEEERKLRARVEELQGALYVANSARHYAEREMRNMERREQGRRKRTRVTSPT